MIGFNYLGKMGQLGNQMFQYAALRGIAKNRNLDFCIPPEKYFGQYDQLVRNDKFNLYNVFDIDSKNIIEVKAEEIK